MKVFLDTHWTWTNCTDNNGNAMGSKVMYAYPEYPFELELKDPSCTDGLVLLDQPDSSVALIDATTQAPWGYEETMPMEIVTTDKSGVTGIKAIWQFEAEARRILETYPTGSQRSVERVSPATKRLGSTTLWSAKYMVKYRRNKTT